VRAESVTLQLGPLTRWFAHPAVLLQRSDVSRALVKGAVWSIGCNVTGAAASFITQVILARSLQATRYGVYSYLLAWVNVAVLFGKLEFDAAAVRFIGAYDGQRRDGLVHGFLRYGWKVVAGTATGVALIAALTAWLLRAHLPAETGGGIWAAGVLVPLSALLLFSGSALQGFRRVPQAQLPQLLLRPVLFGVGIVLAGPVFGFELGAGGAVAINATATALALGVSLSLLARATAARAKAAAPMLATAHWMGAVRGFMVIAAAQLVLSHQVDVLVVGSLLGPRDAGLYSAASQLSTLVSFGAAAIIFVVLPVVSNLHTQRQRAELQRLVARTVQVCVAVSVPVVVLLLVAGHIVLRAYGHGFVDAYPVLSVLSSEQLLGATIGIIAGYLLTMTGHEWEASRVIVGTALLNLLLTFVLTPAFGAVGAAVATLGAQFVRVGLLCWYVQRCLGVMVLPRRSRRTAMAGGA